MLQGPVTISPPTDESELEVQTEEEAIALAIAMCPEGDSIEIHEPECPMRPCSCPVRVITPGKRAKA